MKMITTETYRTVLFRKNTGAEMPVNFSAGTDSDFTTTVLQPLKLIFLMDRPSAKLSATGIFPTKNLGGFPNTPFTTEIRIPFSNTTRSPTRSSIPGCDFFDSAVNKHETCWLSPSFLLQLSVSSLLFPQMQQIPNPRNEVAPSAALCPCFLHRKNEY